MNEGPQQGARAPIHTAAWPPMGERLASTVVTGEPERYWHGGPTVRGDTLLPPSATGRSRSDPDDTADGWVYVTPTRSLAETYAATCRGWVYEVEPIGAVEQDPGSMLPPGESMRCPSARIVRRWRLSRADCDRIAAVVGALDRRLP